MPETRTNPLSYLGEQLEAFKQAGTYSRLRELQSPCRAVSRFDGREVINLASNNYLGLTNHPKLKEAAVEATRKYGVGSGAVRTIAGTMEHAHGAGAAHRGVQARRRPASSSSPASPPTPAPCPPSSRPRTTSSPTS